MTAFAETINSSLSSNLQHPKYRPDIDGLRAVAVLSVVIFHAFPNLLRGGFIGVDIFFVISGFLISTIIFSNIDNHSFSVSEFYRRRVKRIFPALLLVLMCCYALGWFTLKNHEFKELGAHIAGGAGFVSNFLLWSESGYFDSAAETKVLLHLWSLGIEEQFYIVWPVLIWVAARRRLNLLSVVLFISAVSFTLNVIGIKSDSVATFFSPQTRCWELLIGSAVAYLMLYPNKSVTPPPKVLCNVQAATGAVLIVISLVAISKGEDFPGWKALLPTVGSALIIYAGPYAWFNRKVLSNRYLIFIGLMSFPLYLWHWPVLTFVRILADGVAPGWVRLIAVFGSVGLAWLTVELVEKHMRHRKGDGVTIGLLVAMLALGLLGYVTYRADGFSFRYDVSENDLTVRDDTYGKGQYVSCQALVRSLKGSNCVYYERPNVAILGDSHARVLFYGLANSQKADFDRPLAIGSSSCPPALNAELRPGCDSVLKAGLEKVKSNSSVKYVILSAYHGFITYSDADARKKYYDGYERTINELRSQGKNIIIAMDNYTLRESSERCAPTPLLLRAPFNKPPTFCSDLERSDLKPHDEYIKFIGMLKRNHPDLVVFDPEPYFCPSGKCSLFKDGKLLLNDFDHLSKHGSKLYIDSLLSEMSNLR